MSTGRLFLQLILAVGVLAAAIAVGFAIVRPAEVPLAALRTKYSSPASRFLRLADGAHLHVRDEGKPDGRVLLLLPGLHSPLQVWEPWVTRLGDTLRLVSIDLPGQGLSDSWPRDDYSVAALESLVTEVTSALHIERFSIAEHSMSGALAWRYALAHPGRVEKIVLVAAGGIVVEDAGPILAFRVLASPLVGPIARQLITRPFVRATLGMAYADGKFVTRGLVEQYYETINGEGHGATLAKRLQYLLSYEPIERLDRVSVPTLILWGDQDRLRPVVYATIFRDRIRGSILRVYPRVGHFPMDEAADATAADVRAFMHGQASTGSPG